MSLETGHGMMWSISPSPRAWELAEVAANPFSPPRAWRSSIARAPQKQPLFHTACRVTACTSLALCLSFPTALYLCFPRALVT